VVTGAEVGRLYPGIEILIVFTIQQVNDLIESSLPIHWNSDGVERRSVRIASIVREPQDVKSLELEPINNVREPPLWKYQAGQYVSLHLSPEWDGPIVRTYSLSRAHDDSSPSEPPLRYRISVKRHNKGKASRFLHDVARAGDIVSVEAPTGDFTLKPDELN
jgi:ferredoxin-NADP reductase